MGLCAYLIPTKVPADARYQVAESNGWYYTYDTTNNELIDEEKYCTDVRERMVDLVTTLNRKEGMK